MDSVRALDRSFDGAEENVCLCHCPTSEILKQKIREISARYLKIGWALCGLESDGPVIILKFKPFPLEQIGN